MALSYMMKLKRSSSAAHELQLSCTRILEYFEGLNCTELQGQGRVDLAGTGGRKAQSGVAPTSI